MSEGNSFFQSILHVLRFTYITEEHSLELVGFPKYHQLTMDVIIFFLAERLHPKFRKSRREENRQVEIYYGNSSG